MSVEQQQQLLGRSIDRPIMEATPHPNLHLLLSSLLLLHQILDQSPPAAAAAVDSFSPAPAPAPSALTDFIRSSCNITLYPDLCYTSLSRYASAVQQDPAQLARYAIGVSLSHAREAASFISNLSARSSTALNDCSSTLADAIDQIQGSLEEMRGTWRVRIISDVQTWMSAAMTNEDTCLDGFDEEDEEEGMSAVKVEVSRRVAVARKFASNALALLVSCNAAMHKHAT